MEISIQHEGIMYLFSGLPHLVTFVLHIFKNFVLHNIVIDQQIIAHKNICNFVLQASMLTVKM